MLVDRQPAHVQEYRLEKLWQALGSACVIASHLAGEPAVKREMRERAARATDVKKALSQRTDDIIITGAKSVWPGFSSYTAWRIAGIILERVNKQIEAANEQLRAEGKAERLPPLKRHAIDHRLKKLRRLIFQKLDDQRIV